MVFKNLTALDRLIGKNRFTIGRVLNLLYVTGSQETNIPLDITEFEPKGRALHDLAIFVYQAVHHAYKRTGENPSLYHRIDQLRLGTGIGSGDYTIEALSEVNEPESKFMKSLIAAPEGCKIVFSGNYTNKPTEILKVDPGCIDGAFDNISVEDMFQQVEWSPDLGLITGWTRPKQESIPYHQLTLRLRIE